MLTGRAVVSVCAEMCVLKMSADPSARGNFSLRRIEKSWDLLFLSYFSCSLTLKFEKVKLEEVNWRILFILLDIWDLFGKVGSQ